MLACMPAHRPMLETVWMHVDIIIIIVIKVDCYKYSCSVPYNLGSVHASLYWFLNAIVHVCTQVTRRACDVVFVCTRVFACVRVCSFVCVFVY